MKKKLSIVLVLLLLLTSCGNVQQTDNTKIKEILGKDKLVVATSADYPPYEFIKQVDGKNEIVGFDMELARYIAEKWGVEIEIQDVKFESLLTGLETGMYDMVIAGMSPSPERKAEFSDIYYNATQGVLINKKHLNDIKTVEDLQGKHLGVQLGSVQEAILDDMSGIQKKALANINTLVLELKTEKIDGIIMEKPVAKTYSDANPDLVLVEDINITDDSGGSAIAMKEGNVELKNEVNKVISEVQEKGLLEKWVVDANNLVNDTSTPTSYSTFFLEGIKQTLLLSLFSLLVGVLLAFLISFMRMSGNGFISAIAKIYVEIIRGTPLMLQILIVYYGLDSLGIKLTAFIASLLAVSLNSSAYVSEIIRSGIESIDKGQFEAGRSLGLSKNQTMKKIILPQAIKNILPALGNEFVTLIKETSIASTIGVGELMFQTTKVQSLSFEAMKPLFIVSLIYFALTFGISMLMKQAERKLNYDN